MKSYLGVKSAIAVNTAAIELLLSIFDVRGCEVIAPAYTFVSTVNSIIHLGGVPRLVDSSENDFNLDPDELSEILHRDYVLTEKGLTNRKNRRLLKGIIVVHFAGNPADLNKINDCARRNNLFVIEDAAHAFGAFYSGKPIGKTSNFVCFSFYSNKNITTGEGGMIVSDNCCHEADLRSRMLHGLTADNLTRYKKGSVFYDVIYPGYKYNMSDLNAAVGVAQLRKITKLTALRRQAAQYYQTLLKEVAEIQLLQIKPENECCWHLFPVLVPPEKRDALLVYLRENEIQTSVHFKPVHLFSFYQQYFSESISLPVAEMLFKREVSLPLFPSISEAQIKKVVRYLKKFFLQKR